MMNNVESFTKGYNLATMKIQEMGTDDALLWGKTYLMECNVFLYNGYMMSVEDSRELQGDFDGDN
jgi:hypothetical protein